MFQKIESFFFANRRTLKFIREIEELVFFLAYSDFQNFEIFLPIVFTLSTAAVCFMKFKQEKQQTSKMLPFLYFFRMICLLYYCLERESCSFIIINVILMLNYEAFTYETKCQHFFENLQCHYFLTLSAIILTYKETLLNENNGLRIIFNSILLISLQRNFFIKTTRSAFGCQGSIRNQQLKEKDPNSLASPPLNISHLVEDNKPLQQTQNKIIQIEPDSFARVDQSMLKKYANTSQMISFEEVIPWVQGISSLILNTEYEVVYNNFSMENYLIQSDVNQSATSLLLQSMIKVADREVSFLSLNKIGDSVYSDVPDQNDFYLNQVNINNYTIQQLLVDISLNESHKNRVFSLFQLQSKYFDLRNFQIKIFIQSIGPERYFVFLFIKCEQTKPVDSDISEKDLVCVFQNFITTSINYLNGCLTISVILLLDGKLQGLQLIENIRLGGVKFSFYLNNLRDIIFLKERQLFLRMSQFSMSQLMEQVNSIYADHTGFKDLNLSINMEQLDVNHAIISDQDRIRQVLATILNITLFYCLEQTIKIEIKPYGNYAIMVSVRDLSFGKEESTVQKLKDLVSNVNQKLKSSQEIRNINFQENLEIQIIVVLAYMLSGTLKKPLTLTTDNKGSVNFSFVIESYQSEQKYLQINSSDSQSHVKIVGQKRYYDTSLSQVISHQDQSKNEFSKFLEDSKLISYNSKGPGEEQSQLFSQMSKIKVDSSNQSRGLIQQSSQILFNNIQLIQSENNSVIQQQSEQPQSFPTKSLSWFSRKKESVQRNDPIQEQFQQNSVMDFGDSIIDCIQTPQLTTKFLDQVIKYKITNNCCSKVLLVDNDYMTLITMDTILKKAKIRYDKAFDGLHALRLIENKMTYPCFCGNRFYLILFIELNLPQMNGMNLTQQLRDRMQQGTLDRIYLIACTSYGDLNVKLQCFHQGMDYYISKPFDLIEMSAILNYLAC